MVYLTLYASGALVILCFFIFSGVIRYIPNNRIGISEKLWSSRGSVKCGFIALAGEAGFQPAVIRGGFHFFFPFQYRIHSKPLVTIPQGKIGYIFARDGASLGATQTLASNARDFNYEDTAGFIRAGGQKGPQRKILREGTYAINLAQFVVITSDRIFGLLLEAEEQKLFGRMNDLILERQGFEPIVIKNADDMIGVVTVHDGASLAAEQIIAPKVGDDPEESTTFHNNFQDPEASGSHKYDENLCEVSLITKDAFEPSLPLSVVVHIDYRKAPLVVQRFGDVKRLVEQTLDPMVSAYFKNIGQTRTLIQLIQDRSEIQDTASLGMKEKFGHYNLELEEVLIGTPKAGIGSGSEQIEKILTQLRLRQIAEEQIETYGQQQKAAVKERDLREAEARAKQQAGITESELSITVQTNEGKAAFARSQQEADRIRTLARAESDKISSLAAGEARRVELMADAEAARATRVGIGQAIAIEEQVRAYGGPKFQLTQQVMNRFAEAIEKSGIDIVPKIAINSGQAGESANAGSGTLFESLLALFLSDKMGLDVSAEKTASSKKAGAIRTQLLAQAGKGAENTADPA